MEENLDLITSLPNEILKHIISMISFKEAVQTSTLSTSWRSLFSVLSVNIEQDLGQANTTQAKNKLEEIIKAFLQSGESLKLYLSLCNQPFAIATKGAHGELHLDFSVQKQLEKVPSNLSMILEQSSFSCPAFAYVKILQLKSVPNLVGNLVNDLFSSCQNLESLKLEKCFGLENLEIKTNGFLKSFEIADCRNIVRVEISAENLNFFSYEGAYAIIQLIEVPNLVDFALNLRDGSGNNAFDCEDALALLCSVKDVEILTMSSWLLEALCSSGVIFNQLDFQFNNLKELWCVCPKISSKIRDSLACFLNVTPSLEQLFVKIDETSTSPLEFPLSNQYWHEPHLWKDYATVKSSAYQLKDLKTIKIIGFKDEKDELLLMDLLLHYAINLKDMTVDSWRVSRIPYSQLIYVKVKYMLISCPNTSYYFVLTKAKNYNLN
ncbi:hypothetical protein CDL12_12291 [Handroanthus impetiginosus]|uniref:F-box domain-containing protein n=1 Tax=Handroanthus impetiginosus TaxID=429701 RepID=A0A2G9HCN5_9LAMI|nr:hypothetical protein CDL12_12291 [Handroanthus impetiginosus]